MMFAIEKALITLKFGIMNLKHTLHQKMLLRWLLETKSMRFIYFFIFFSSNLIFNYFFLSTFRRIKDKFQEKKEKL